MRALAYILSVVLVLVVAAQGQAAPGCPGGDLTGDCQVDADDLGVLAEQWLGQGGRIADLDGDSRVDGSDYALLADDWRHIGTPVIISEFVAINNSRRPARGGELLDEDGDSSDWIELCNVGSQEVVLDGWYLTDRGDDLRRWEIPAIGLGPGRFKIIFASGKDRNDPDSELHANFRLAGGSGFLALVKPDGQTIAHSYDYPDQFGDISYGVAFGEGASSTLEVLLPEYADATALLPDDSSLGLRWTEVGFDDSAWLTGKSGVGYDYGGLIGLDVGAMRNVIQTAYIRVPFEVDSVADLAGLTLRMKFDDGFAAYLNGRIIAGANAPDAPQLRWNSGAAAQHSDSEAVNFVDFALPDDYIDYLQIGTNVLAIHGLNVTLSSSDLLILPTLVAKRVQVIDTSSLPEGYFLEPTPGGANGPIWPNLGPRIGDVTENPPPPSADEDLVITADVAQTLRPVSEVRLPCRINYSQGSRWLPPGGFLMVDDGSGADEVAGDGTYTAVVPSILYGRGDMVRWCVVAGDADGVETRKPSFLIPDDSPEHFGTVVKDPSINTSLPVIRWFVENVAASETDGGARGSVYYLGQFYDNVMIHRRGGSTAGMPKKHFKFLFNHGHKFQYDPNCPRVNEFNLNSTYSDKAYLRQNLAFEAYDWCGCPGSESFLMRAQRNGQFYGVQVFIEEPEEELLEREGLDPDGALYKMYNTFNAGGSAEKKTRRWEGRSDLDDFCRSINNASGAVRHNNIFDRVNLPLTLNYLVATILTHQNDHPHKNHYLYRDSDGSGQWCFMPWDHDLTWGSNWTGSSFHDYIYADDDQVPGKPTDVKPSHPFVGKRDCQEWNYHWNGLIDALLEDPVVRQMYLRRLRTVMDELLKPPGTPYGELFIENHIDELVAMMAPDAAMDYLKWANPWPWGGQGGYPRDQSLAYAINVLKNDYLAVRRVHLFVTHNVDRAGSYNIPGSHSARIPNAQPIDPRIDFGRYDYNPVSGNQDAEYIELVNPNGYAVDISGWRLVGGVEHEFLPGTVIAGYARLYVSPNVGAFLRRAIGPTGGQGLFVQGDYKGHLSSWGETIKLVDRYGRLVSTLTYPGNPSDQQRYLRVTEVMYNPPSPAEGSPHHRQEYEYVELRNVGAGELFLSGVKFTNGIFYDFPGVSLSAGGYVVVAKNPEALGTRYNLASDLLLLGPYDGQLSNAGERVKLEDRTNSTIADFEYRDNWYDITDGLGFSLTVQDPTAPGEPNALSDKALWRPSAAVHGSPGEDDSGQVPVIGDVVINEILSHSHAGQPDWIELHNTTNQAINIGGWFLSDDADNLQKYEIAQGTTIPPNGYIVFYEDTDFGNLADPGTHQAFALSENGETLYLHSGADGQLTGYSEQEKFGASETGVTLGRYRKSTGTYNFVAMTEPTPGAVNSYPKVGPIVISEIMYNPDTVPDAEYVELLNISDTSLVLYDFVEQESWRFTDDPDNPGIELIFPSDGPVIVAAGETILLVKDLTLFQARFTLPQGVQVFEWGAGRLANGNEKIQLSRPGDVDLDQERHWIRVDRVVYSDGSHHDDFASGVDPWPTEPDGQGQSLTRINPTSYGNDPANWQATTPTPGAVY